MVTAPPAEGSPPDIELYAALFSELDAYWGAPGDALLSAPERERLRRLRDPGLARRFVLTRASLRRLIGARIGQPAESLEFETGAHGRPALIGGALRFNLSHTDAGLLIGLSADHDIGVDLEHNQPKDALAIAARFFAASEHDTLAAMPEVERGAAFLRQWTLKEAFLKAEGRGIGGDLARYAFILGEEPPQLGSPGADWRFASFPLLGGWAAWACRATTPLRARLHPWPWPELEAK